LGPCTGIGWDGLRLGELAGIGWDGLRLKGCAGIGWDGRLGIGPRIVDCDAPVPGAGRAPGSPRVGEGRPIEVGATRGLMVVGGGVAIGVLS
jgi:hypothetical protein